MNILHLPEEVIISICGLLDLKSKLRLYDTCTTLRRIVCIQSLSKSCTLSMNTIATVNTLQCPYMKVVSHHLEELDISGVTDVTRSRFIPCLKRMINLKTLNVAYTKLTITDFLDKKLKLVNLKNITMNYSFGDNVKVSISTLDECQKFFKNFDNIHFVGALSNIIHSNIPMYILSKSKLISLKLTVFSVFLNTIYMNIDEVGTCNFQQFSIHFPAFSDFPMLQNSLNCLLQPIARYNQNIFDIAYYEFLIILKIKSEYEVYASRGLKCFVEENFHVKTKCFAELQTLNTLYSNSVMFFWNIENLDLNKTFFDTLLLKIKDFFPNQAHNIDKLKFSFRNSHSSWYYISPTVKQTKRECGYPENSPMELFKKKRVGLSTQTLGFDEILNDEKDVKIKIFYPTTPPYQFAQSLKISLDSKYLSNITVLSIVGRYTFSEDFFLIVFKNCVNLITLNVENVYPISCYLFMDKYIHLGQKLKNFRLCDNDINLNLLFLGLGRCKSIENINVINSNDYSETSVKVNDFNALISKCTNLYSVYLRTNISLSRRKQLLRELTSYKLRNQLYYLNIEIFKNDTPIKIYNRFMDVFPIHQFNHV